MKLLSKRTGITCGKVKNGYVKILIIIIGIAFTISCKDEEDLILETTMLQGTWVEVEPEDLGQFVGSNHSFTFREDSFFLKLYSWTDVVYVDEDGNWLGPNQYGYRKGKYSFDANTIRFEGMGGLNSDFTEPVDFSQVNVFHWTFNYRLKSTNTIILNPDSEYESITLVKE